MIKQQKLQNIRKRTFDLKWWIWNDGEQFCNKTPKPFLQTKQQKRQKQQNDGNEQNDEKQEKRFLRQKH